MGEGSSLRAGPSSPGPTLGPDALQLKSRRQKRQKPLGIYDVVRIDVGIGGVDLDIEDRIEDPASGTVRIVADQDGRATKMVVHNPMIGHQPQRIGTVLAVP